MIVFLFGNDHAVSIIFLFFRPHLGKLVVNLLPFFPLAKFKPVLPEADQIGKNLEQLL